MSKNVGNIVFVIIGTLIGAGFASGQEIYTFFFCYGMEGLIGIFISSLIMGFVIYRTLNLIKQNNIKTYKDLLEIFIKPKQEEKFFNLKNVINIVINLFILITFFIMIAGFGAYFEQELGINRLVGSTLLAVICFIIFMTNVKGVVKASGMIVPILILFVGIVGIINLKDIHFLELGNYLPKVNDHKGILNAILYASYNSILFIPVLITLKNYLTDKKQIKKIAIITTGIMIFLSSLIFFLLVKVDVDISNLEMPAVYVVSNMFGFLKVVYGFIILCSIFTTAISLGMSFLQNTSKNKKSYPQIALIMCITSVAVSQIGFSNLINSLYPIFGYLGLIQLLMLGIKKR